MYLDCGKGDVYIDWDRSQQEQTTICALREGDLLQLQAKVNGNRWLITTPEGKCIGALSNAETRELAANGIQLGKFTFNSGEVSVGQIVWRLKIDKVTSKVLEDWFVPLSTDSSLQIGVNINVAARVHNVVIPP